MNIQKTMMALMLCVPLVANAAQPTEVETAAFKQKQKAAIIGAGYGMVCGAATLSALRSRKRLIFGSATQDLLAHKRNMLQNHLRLPSLDFVIGSAKVTANQATAVKKAPSYIDTYLRAAHLNVDMISQRCTERLQKDITKQEMADLEIQKNCMSHFHNIVTRDATILAEALQEYEEAQENAKKEAKRINRILSLTAIGTGALATAAMMNALDSNKA